MLQSLTGNPYPAPLGFFRTSESPRKLAISLESTSVIEILLIGPSDFQYQDWLPYSLKIIYQGMVDNTVPEISGKYLPEFGLGGEKADITGGW